MTDPLPNPREPLGRGCAELLECLAAEEAALEDLLFKLREQHMVLSSGEHRWLPRCTREVEAAVGSLTRSGARREDVSARVNASHGLADGASLGALAEKVGDELICQRLLQRQRTLRDMLDQVRRCSRQNREMLAHGLAATNDALALLGTVPTYDSAGGKVRPGKPTVRSFDSRA